MKFVKCMPFVLLLGLIACDETPNEIVDQKLASINVKQIEAPAGFIYTQSDSMFVASVEFDDSENIESVWATVKSVDGEITVSEETKLVDDGSSQNSGDEKSGDSIYSAKIVMSKIYPNGKYVVDFFVNISSGDSKKIGSHVLIYDNGQNNYVPVISNLVYPTIIELGNAYTFTLKAEDPNSIYDIESVNYEVYRPDGTQVSNSSGITKFPMYDDGVTAGDVTEADGIYTVTLTFPTGQQTGNWKFVFQAVDRNGLQSNIITQELTVK